MSTPTSTPGVRFPAEADGTQSTTRAGAQILAAALAPPGAGLADAALAESGWRRACPRHFRALVEHGLADATAALRCADAGLDAA